MTKNNFKNLVNSVSVVIAGFVLCVLIAGKINKDLFHLEFSGFCMLFTAGVITYSAGSIIDEIKDLNNNQK